MDIIHLNLHINSVEINMHVFKTYCTCTDVVRMLQLSKTSEILF